MSRTYSVTEPHPSVAKDAYLGSGRGGAGNYAHYTPATLTAGPNATGPAALIDLTRPTARPQRTVFAGRGGAGNMYKSHTPRINSPEPAIFQFDEELLKRRSSPAPIFHFGRGGAANFVDETKAGTAGKPTGRTGSTGSAASVSSERSGAGSSVRRSMEGAFGKLARRVSKD
ncbi:hypothetical protein LTR36_009759 [Oleoguttula mirabilis]|uniref:Uncharacterized protein n=1 Tax=Oleoguttula mirabilis TaxID=1507867 RepID=A0AAV9J5M3_9PEZI|nr:hypothetical protein LTR36_009759 [Oleoguttula mirabilis]